MTRLRASSTSTARSTARPRYGACRHCKQAAAARSSRSRRPAGNRAPQLQAVRTAHTRLRASSTSTARSTARPTTGARTGCGTVFAITTSGKETVLHSFKGGSADGAYPSAGLINVNGTLYGTTQFGGRGQRAERSSRSQRPARRPCSTASAALGDGAAPYAGLINVNGTLYGTTDDGGANGDGTVFAITPSGKETVLHSFKGGSADGEYPNAGLINVNGTLYGTTSRRGRNLQLKRRLRNGLRDHDVRQGNRAPQLQRFGRRRRSPYAGLLNVNGTLYGTTEFGAHAAAKRGAERSSRSRRPARKPCSIASRLG